MLSITPIQFELLNCTAHNFEHLFEKLILRRDSQTAVYYILYKKYGRLLNRAIYHNNEE